MSLRVPRRLQLPPATALLADALATPELDRQALDRLDQPAGARAADAPPGRALRHDAPRRRAVRRRRPHARGQARDRPRARRGRDRPDRGRLPAGLRRRLAGGRADRRRRAARRGVGLLPGRPGRRRGARRARRHGVRDREPDLGREARRARRLARLDARADPQGGLVRRRRTGSTSRSSASTRRAPTSEFFRRAYDAAVEAGAKEVVVVDTIGIATPEAAALLVGEAVDLARPRDPRALARARRLRARDRCGGRRRAGRRHLGAGHDQRDGGARRERRPDRGRARARGALRDPDPARPDPGARARRGSSQERAGTPLAPWKAVTGENLFVRESGAVAAQFHDPPAIEPYASELVGQERGIVLGKKSGLDSIRIKVAELGLDVPEERYAGAARAGEAGRHREARARHRRRVQPARRRRDGARRAGAVFPPDGLADDAIRVRRLAERDADRCSSRPRRSAAPPRRRLPVHVEHTPETVREPIERRAAGAAAHGRRCAELAIADRADGRVPRLVHAARLPLVGVRRPRSATGCCPRRAAEGVAARAVRLLSRWAIEELGLTRIEAYVPVDNEPSLRSIEHAGFTQEGVARAVFDNQRGRSTSRGTRSFAPISRASAAVRSPESARSG